jgi:hypothetical protein
MSNSSGDLQSINIEMAKLKKEQEDKAKGQNQATSPTPAPAPVESFDDLSSTNQSAAANTTTVLAQQNPVEQFREQTEAAIQKLKDELKAAKNELEAQKIKVEAQVKAMAGQVTAMTNQLAEAYLQGYQGSKLTTKYSIVNSYLGDDQKIDLLTKDEEILLTLTEDEKNTIKNVYLSENEEFDVENLTDTQEKKLNEALKAKYDDAQKDKYRDGAEQKIANMPATEQISLLNDDQLKKFLKDDRLGNFLPNLVTTLTDENKKQIESTYRGTISKLEGALTDSEQEALKKLLNDEQNRKIAELALTEEKKIEIKTKYLKDLGKTEDKLTNSEQEALKKLLNDEQNKKYLTELDNQLNDGRITMEDVRNKAAKSLESANKITITPDAATQIAHSAGQLSYDVTQTVLNWPYNSDTDNAIGVCNIISDGLDVAIDAVDAANLGPDGEIIKTILEILKSLANMAICISNMVQTERDVKAGKITKEEAAAKNRVDAAYMAGSTVAVVTESISVDKEIKKIDASKSAGIDILTAPGAEVSPVIPNNTSDGFVNASTVGKVQVDEISISISDASTIGEAGIVNVRPQTQGRAA